jgi:predicted nucleotidyltransferase
VAQRTTAIRSTFDRLLEALLAESRRHYGDRLVALAVFGSVGRRTMRPDSDIDALLVVDRLPNGRIPRIEDFGRVETVLAPALEAARDAGVDTRIAAVIRTPSEIAAGSPLMFDMIEDARILHDPRGVLQRALDDLKRRLERLGARRIWRDGWWYWDLKPDYRPGEVFEV